MHETYSHSASSVFSERSGRLSDIMKMNRSLDAVSNDSPHLIIGFHGS
jgi:hypothetical protein